MHRYYVKLAHYNGEWCCVTVLARNEQFAVWAAFDELPELPELRGGWRATQVTILTENFR
jgi:hypothetical protein